MGCVPLLPPPAPLGLIRPPRRCGQPHISSSRPSASESKARGWTPKADGLLLGHFEENTLAEGSFDAVLCHRLLHLLVSRKAVAQFVEQAQRVLRRGGLLCVGVRNTNDLDLTSMTWVDDNVYEYTQRPGHRIRSWD